MRNNSEHKAISDNQQLVECKGSTIEVLKPVTAVKVLQIIVFSYLDLKSQLTLIGIPGGEILNLDAFNKLSKVQKNYISDFIVFDKSMNKWRQFFIDPLSLNVASVMSLPEDVLNYYLQEKPSLKALKTRTKNLQRKLDRMDAQLKKIQAFVDNQEKKTMRLNIKNNVNKKKKKPNNVRTYISIGDNSANEEFRHALTIYLGGYGWDDDDEIFDDLKKEKIPKTLMAALQEMSNIENINDNDIQRFFSWLDNLKCAKTEKGHFNYVHIFGVLGHKIKLKDMNIGQINNLIGYLRSDNIPTNIAYYAMSRFKELYEEYAGGNAVIFAVLQGHKTVLEYFLQYGAGVNFEDIIVELKKTPYYERGTFLKKFKNTQFNTLDLGDELWTDLIKASDDNYFVEMIETLSEQCNDIDRTVGWNETALMHASANGCVFIVERLLRNGADINKLYGDKTALYVACRYGRHEIVVKLLEHGARIHIDDEYYNALIIASRYGYCNIVESLLNHEVMNVDTIYFIRRNPLMHASQKGHVDVVATLLANGAEINTTNDDDKSALDFALSNNHVAVVKKLLENGADIRKLNGDNKARLLLLGDTNYDIDEYLKLFRKAEKIKKLCCIMLAIFLLGLSIYSFIDFKYLGISIFSNAKQAYLLLIGSMLGGVFFASDLYKILSLRQRTQFFKNLAILVAKMFLIEMLAIFISPMIITSRASALTFMSIASSTYASASIIGMGIDKCCASSTKNNAQNHEM
ncbi:MAG: hypothetical protein COB50_04975 [Thiotrichales bacterium]|nr:MAG: hypothetical protein COB50_04975 [Thiotrichales bacterium]